MNTKLLRLPYRALALILSFYFVVTTLTLSPEKQTPIDPSQQKLGVTIMADVHTEGNNLPRFQVLATCFKNLNAWKDSTDALMLLGDNTMNGQTFEHLFLYSMLEHVNPIKPYYTIVGNHDVGNDPDGDFESFARRNLGVMQAFIDKDLQTLYYSRVINGYRFIFLAPDEAESGSRYFSDEQLDFLEAQLNAAKETDLPVFVLNHYPASHISSRCRDRYEDLLNSYDKIFVIVGHMHYYARISHIAGEADTPEIWVPNLCDLDNNETVTERTGRGYRLEVYDDSVVFRYVNYYKNTVSENITHKFTLTGESETPTIPLPWIIA